MNQGTGAAAAYEAFIGRWSRNVAIDFLHWLHVPAGADWCDVACGTGALTQSVLSACDPGRIDASDRDAVRIAFARQTIVDARATFAIGDAAAIAAPDRTYDAVIGGLAFPAIPNTAAALAEFARVAKDGGTVAGYVWDFDGEMQLLRYFWDAADDELPGAEETDDERFAICHPDRLGAAWGAAGYSDVAVRAIDGQARFKDFEEFWTPFLTGDSPAQTHVASLANDARERLRTKLQTTLPIEANGSISLITRAWSVKGTRTIGNG